MCIFNLRVKIRSEGMWIMVLFKRPGGWYFFSKYKTACVYVILSLIAFMLLNSINSFHQYMSSLFLPPTYMLSCSLFPIFASLTLSLSLCSQFYLAPPLNSKEDAYIILCFHCFHWKKHHLILIYYLTKGRNIPVCLPYFIHLSIFPCRHIYLFIYFLYKLGFLYFL